MPSSPLFRWSVLIVFILAFAAPLHAQQDIHATIEQVHDLLKQAMDDDGAAPPSKDQQAQFLKQAADLLHELPPGHYHGHRVAAERLIKAAQDQVASGDGQAKETIRNADFEVRELE